MKLIFILLANILFSVIVNAQTSTFFVEEQNIYSEGRVTPQGFMQVNHYFKDSKYGVFSYTSVSSQWGELIVGGTKTYSLKRDGLVEIGLGGGIETGANSFRGATYIFTIINSGKHKVTGLINGEYGGSGYWYVGFLTIDITKNFVIGVHAQYGAASGPRLQYQTKHFMLWGSTGVNLETKSFGTVTGIRVTF